MTVYDLEAQYDGCKSFYGKAKIEVNGDRTSLISYNTVVATLENGVLKIFGTYSRTTKRHIVEFLKQYNFPSDNKFIDETIEKS